ncbi:MAG: hypothetical protein J3K34DRAFT_412859 [Monoraphidium minutum]|nr:MAG: hypothetical protein J3K34DRAFT_412859 [Monoraphidium minutum]
MQAAPLTRAPYLARRAGRGAAASEEARHLVERIDYGQHLVERRHVFGGGQQADDLLGARQQREDLVDRRQVLGQRRRRQQRALVARGPHRLRHGGELGQLQAGGVDARGRQQRRRRLEQAAERRQADGQARQADGVQVGDDARHSRVEARGERRHVDLCLGRVKLGKRLEGLGQLLVQHLAEDAVGLRQRVGERRDREAAHAAGGHQQLRDGREAKLLIGGHAGGLEDAVDVGQLDLVQGRQELCDVGKLDAGDHPRLEVAARAGERRGRGRGRGASKHCQHGREEEEEARHAIDSEGRRGRGWG